MTLHAIVAAFGGDLYQGGWRANVPAPGHSADDRSVSLLLAEGRVIIHGFGAADWREMRDLLRSSGFIDDAAEARGTLTGEMPRRSARAATKGRSSDSGVSPWERAPRRPSLPSARRPSGR